MTPDRTECARCPAPATAWQRFTYRRKRYAVPLCARHDTPITSDLDVWVHVARLVRTAQPSQPRQPAQAAQAGRVVPATAAPSRPSSTLVVARGEVIDHDGPTSRVLDPSEPIEGWTFTRHAYQRLQERQIDSRAVWRALRRGSITVIHGYLTIRGKGSVKYSSPEVVVVVDPATKEILSVGYGDFNRDEPVEP